MASTGRDIKCPASARKESSSSAAGLLFYKCDYFAFGYHVALL